VSLSLFLVSFGPFNSHSLAGDFEHAMEELKGILRHSVIRDKFKLEEKVVDGIFVLINGVVDKDPRAVMNGLPQLKRSVLFFLSVSFYSSGL
jgi:hypothetical protein